jgi:HPt (histidine-containing phosphotransfer) domain-containing protein
MKNVTLDEQLYDAIIAETDDDPMNMVPPELLHLIPGFLERRENEVHELSELVAQSQFEGIRLIGHKLKGMGAGYGFPLVTEIGRDLEGAAKAGDTKGIQASIRQLANFVAGLKALLMLKSDD